MSCQNPKETLAQDKTWENYEIFGDSLSFDKILTTTEMKDTFKKLQKGDTVSVSFESTIEEVCQKKGCWMKVELGDSLSSFVRFTDYAYFVPMNAAEQRVVLEGKAFVDEITIEELKHFAEDAGKTAEEIAAITQPKITYSFRADGVAIQK